MAGVSCVAAFPPPVEGSADDRIRSQDLAAKKITPVGL